MIEGNNRSEELESIEVIMFVLSSYCFAIDIEDISEIIEVEEAEANEINLVSFQERLALKSHTLTFPKVVIGKNKSDGYIIEEPDDIYRVHVESIKTVPVIYDKCGKHPSVWGVVFIKEKTVLLIDIDEL
ncbi:MAG: hypothetical protein HQK84_01860 [Nitrospinae bacterium]|nr:hypothetical protein [Nitrospinota bacterium]